MTAVEADIFKPLHIGAQLYAATLVGARIGALLTPQHRALNLREADTAPRHGGQPDRPRALRVDGGRSRRPHSVRVMGSGEEFQRRRHVHQLLVGQTAAEVFANAPKVGSGGPPEQLKPCRRQPGEHDA